MTDSRIKIQYSFFCDDVRREDNGKYIFIGAYTQTLVVPQFPLPLSIFFFIHGKTETHGRFPFRIQVLFMPGDLTLFKMGGTSVFERGEASLANLDLSFGFSFQLQREGYLSLQFSQVGEEWQELNTLVIREEKKPSSSDA